MSHVGAYNKSLPSAMLRVGKVKYLNTLPLFYRLEGFEIVEGHPSELVEKLRAGEIDAGIVSSVEYLLGKDRYLPLPDVSITSRGRVCSVLLLSNKRLEDIKKVKLTPSSLTSRLLLRFVLKEGYGREFEEVEGGEDALLSIGDEALELRDRYRFYWDLGEEWFKLTNLPFVFALFLVRKEVPKFWVNLLRSEIWRSRTEFYRDLRAGRVSVEGFSEDFIKTYFSSCISYSLRAEEVEGLRLFFRFVKAYNTNPK